MLICNWMVVVWKFVRLRGVSNEHFGDVSAFLSGRFNLESVCQLQKCIADKYIFGIFMI